MLESDLQQPQSHAYENGAQTRCSNEQKRWKQPDWLLEQMFPVDVEAWMEFLGWERDGWFRRQNWFSLFFLLFALS